MRLSHPLYLAALVMSALVAAPATAQEPEREPAPAVEAAQAPATPRTFALDQGAVVARDAAGQTVWRHRVATNEQTKVYGPAAVGSSLFYCARSYVWETDAATGVVSRRHYLRGECEALSAHADGVSVKVKGDDAGPKWSWGETITIAPGQQVTPRFSEKVFGQVMLRGQAMQLLEKPPKDGESPDAAHQELARLAAQDPTNPWYRAAQASALHDLGREAEAQAAREALLKLDPAYHTDLVAASMLVDRDDPELAGKLFDMGLKRAMEAGYEPELANGLIHLVVHFGSLGKLNLDPKKPEDLKRLDRLGERLFEYAPRAEMVASFYAGMAEAHRTAGDEARAAVWSARAQDEAAQSLFGVPSSDARRAGILLTVLMAMLWAFPLGLFIKSARTLGARFPEGTSPLVRYNPLSRWSRWELIGMIALLPLIHLVALRVAAGVATVGMLASAPLSVASGALDGPAALRFMAEGAGSPGGDLIHGVYLHRAGKLAEAEVSYSKSATPEAKNNLGVLKAERGDAAGAEALWREVAGAVPEAAHNLGQPADSPRVARAKRLGVTRPLLALPTQAEWDSMWHAKLNREGGQVVSPVTSVFALAQMTDAISPEEIQPSPGAFALSWLAWLIVILGVAALATSWGRPEPAYKKWHMGGWALGHLAPGMARQWGPLGPLVTALVLTAWLAHMSMVGGGSPSILDNIALPITSSYYGVSGAVYPAHMAPLAALGRWWWAIWLVGIVISLALEALMRDPAGPRRA